MKFVMVGLEFTETSNDGYVWYERLIVKDIYKTAGGKILQKR